MLGHDDEAKEWWNTYVKTLGNGNVNVNLQTHNCRNTNPENFVMEAKEILKPLLNLKPAHQVEEHSLLSKIIPIKVLFSYYLLIKLLLIWDIKINA